MLTSDDGSSRRALTKDDYNVDMAAACFLFVFVDVSFSKQWFWAKQSPNRQVCSLLGQQMELHTGNHAADDGDET